MRGGELESGGLNNFMRAPVVARIINQILYALNYIHEMNIVHRDIKAANILLSHPVHEPDLVAKLADFGMSCLNDPN